MKFWNFQANLHELGLFHLYFVCKCGFREISMIKIVIWDQSKQISLILKIDRFLGDAFGVLSCQFWSIVLQSGALLPIHTLNY